MLRVSIHCVIISVRPWRFNMILRYKKLLNSGIMGSGKHFKKIILYGREKNASFMFGYCSLSGMMGNLFAME